MESTAPLNCDKAIFAQLTDLRQNVMTVIILVKGEPDGRSLPNGFKFPVEG